MDNLCNLSLNGVVTSNFIFGKCGKKVFLKLFNFLFQHLAGDAEKNQKNSSVIIKFRGWDTYPGRPGYEMIKLNVPAWSNHCMLHQW
jgi:hypothetical protein